MIIRFSKSQRFAHFVGALSIMLLFLTGLSITFSEYLRWLAMIMGGYRITMVIHRIAAIALIFVSIYLLTDYIISLARRETRIRDILFNYKDIADFLDEVAYALRMSPEEPKFSKYNWLMKASLSFVILEIFVFIVTGLILWFPWIILDHLPRHYLLAIASIHRNLAIMSMIHVISHSFGNHFHPKEFPLNKVIFTGKISEEKVKEEFTLWYEELKGEKQ
mgnify:CR=1 FL=1